MAEPGTGGEIESEGDAKREGKTEAELWKQKIDRALADEKSFRDTAKKAVEIYEAQKDKSVAFNILHSNIKTIVPAIYNSTPVPDVRRRFSDNDPIAKNVGDATERLISFDIDQFDLDDEMEMMMTDGHVAGRGIIRVRYRAQQSGNFIIRRTTCERWPYDRIVIGPARSWGTVRWIAFQHDLTKDQLQRLGVEAVRLSNMGFDEVKAGEGDNRGIEKSAQVWEIWCKDTRKIKYLIYNDIDDGLAKVLDDPLGLPEFFPILKPYMPISRISQYLPVTPYFIYEKLANELDIITKRITRLTEMLKYRGLTDASIKADVDAIMSADDGDFIDSQSAKLWANGAGGLESAIYTMPLDQLTQALAGLYVQRDQVKATIHEVIGLSDVLRGASDARETAAAQHIKSEWGSLRINNHQRAGAKLARELFRMMAAIYQEHYDPETISTITGLPMNDQQRQIWPQVLQLFKSDLMSFKIDIETDSTIRGDMARSQEQMNLFLQATAQFATSMGGVLQIAPDLLVVAVEVYTSFARQFKLGKQAEDALDQLSQRAPEMAQKAAQGDQEGQAEAQAQMQLEMAKLEQAVKLKAIDKEINDAKNAVQLQIAEITAQGAHIQHQDSIQLEYDKLAHQKRKDARELELKAEQMDIQEEQADEQRAWEDYHRNQDREDQKRIAANDR